MRQKAFTKAQENQLRKNGQMRDKDHAPVVKFFCPWGAATWLISEMDDDGDTMFALCDLGHGCTELGYVSLSELKAIRGPFGMTIERDLHFSTKEPMSSWVELSKAHGRIVA